MLPLPGVSKSDRGQRNSRLAVGKPMTFDFASVKYTINAYICFPLDLITP